MTFNPMAATARRILSLCLLAAAVIPSASAQTWTEQSQPVGSTIWTGVEFVDQNNGWVVGVSGDILHTTDGGSHWSRQTSGTTHQLHNITAVSATTAWACGSEGTVLHTTNGGSTWVPQTAGGSANSFRALYFFDANTGWVAGPSPNPYPNTTNGGSTWILSGTAPSDFYAFDIRFADAQRGWAVGWGIWQTTDGGMTWDRQVADSHTGGLTHVALTDATTAGRSAAVRGLAGTSICAPPTAGASWDSMDTGVANALWGVAFPDSNTGWAVGAGGVIVNTLDGGRTWLRQDSIPMNAFYDVCFVDTEHGWAVGSDGKIAHYEAPSSVPPMVSLRPLQTTLSPAYPNPFNPSTILGYTLSTAGPDHRHHLRPDRPQGCHAAQADPARWLLFPELERSRSTFRSLPLSSANLRHQCHPQADARQIARARQGPCRGGSRPARGPLASGPYKDGGAQVRLRRDLASRTLRPCGPCLRCKGFRIARSASGMTPGRRAKDTASRVPTRRGSDVSRWIGRWQTGTLPRRASVPVRFFRDSAAPKPRKPRGWAG